MSRRIQLVRTTRGSSLVAGYEYNSLELRIYAPLGKATLEHDAEMLLLAIAAAVIRGSGVLTQRVGWEINGVAVDEAPKDFLAILHGSLHRPLSRPTYDKITAEVVVFDVAEVVVDGQVWWKIDAGDFFNPNAIGETKLLTAAEMLLSAAATLLKGRHS